jgi:hypothetical protein
MRTSGSAGDTAFDVKGMQAGFGHKEYDHETVAARLGGADRSSPKSIGPC